MSDFTELLRCPETKQKLAPATAELLEALRLKQEAGNVFYKSGKPVAGLVEAGLVREDGLVLYAVRDGIPVLVIEEAIPLAQA